ncbi:MAG: diguanylate cyclase [Gammaproteobacteria bacterium]|nr:diguanylate cyclase [Gammaproteobacteria bacterium]
MITSLSKAIIKQALDVSPVATAIIDLASDRNAVVYVNQAFEALSGYESGEMVGRSWDELTVAHGGLDGARHTAELHCHPRLGASDRLLFDLLPLYDRPGEPRYWVASERPVATAEQTADAHDRDALLSVLRDARRHIRRLEGRDNTTGVLNSRAFQELLERDWGLARRNRNSLALLVFQIDSFATYCDVFGRQGGNACVRKVAHAISGSLRRTGDLTARLSEDRFVVLMGNADTEAAASFADQIAARVRELAIHHPRSLHDRFVTVSCGYAALTPGATQSSEDLLRHAEQNLDALPRGQRRIAAQI